MWKQFIVAFVKCRSTQDELIQDDWTRKRRKGIGKRRCKTSPKDSSWQHPRYHQASYSTSCSSWWSETYLWTHLRGDPWSPQGLPWERHQGCRHLHRTRQEEDRHRHGCRLCPQEARPHLVRIRRLRRTRNPVLLTKETPNPRPFLGPQNISSKRIFNYLLWETTTDKTKCAPNCKSLFEE